MWLTLVTSLVNYCKSGFELFGSAFWFTLLSAISFFPYILNRLLALSICFLFVCFNTDETLSSKIILYRTLLLNIVFIIFQEAYSISYFQLLWHGWVLESFSYLLCQPCLLGSHQMRVQKWCLSELSASAQYHRLSSAINKAIDEGSSYKHQTEHLPNTKMSIEFLKHANQALEWENQSLQ